MNNELKTTSQRSGWATGISDRASPSPLFKGTRNWECPPSDSKTNIRAGPRGNVSFQPGRDGEEMAASPGASLGCDLRTAGPTGQRQEDALFSEGTVSEIRAAALGEQRACV